MLPLLTATKLVRASDALTASIRHTVIVAEADSAGEAFDRKLKFEPFVRIRTQLL